MAVSKILDISVSVSIRVNTVQNSGFFFVSLLDGLVLGGGHIGENEYIQLLLLLEKGIKSIP